MSNTIHSDSSDHRLCILTGLFEIALVGCTLPMWIGSHAFAAVPLFAGLGDVSFVVDKCLTAVLVIACAACLIPTVRVRYSNVVCVVSILVGLSLVMLNQHRLQPWHWLFLLVAGQQLLHQPDRDWLNRITLASIYFFAAVSRFGPQLAEGMSLQVLAAAVKFLSLDHLLKAPLFVFMACTTMNLVELLIALLLLFQRTRKAGVVLAVILHLSLLMFLGPLGLNHQPGVLLWNLYLLIAIPMVFRLRQQPHLSGIPETAHPSADGTAISRGAVFFATCVIAFPASGLFGLADNWPSWQVYSPRPEVVKLFVASDAVERLPRVVQEHTANPPPLQKWCPVLLNRWSLAETGAPIYPEDRFQLAIARDVVSSLNKDEWQLQIDRPMVPCWWRREVIDLRNLKDVKTASAKHVFNSAVCRRP